jgi:hypothetical protein
MNNGFETVVTDKLRFSVTGWIFRLDTTCKERGVILITSITRYIALYRHMVTRPKHMFTKPNYIVRPNNKQSTN